MPTTTLPDFVSKWRDAALTERAGAQMHFIELCDALAYPHPAADDHSGESYTFEKGVTTTTYGQGFVDVWKPTGRWVQASWLLTDGRRRSATAVARNGGRVARQGGSSLEATTHPKA